MRLQSATSDVCGQYCIMFLHYMASGRGIRHFLDNFTADSDKNDDVVKNFVKYKNADYEFVGHGGCNIRCMQNSCAKMSLM